MNLAETQATLKKAIVIVAILTFTFYFGRFLIVQSINIYRMINPPDLPEPEADFGPLPQLKMTQIQINGDPTYSLDTETGRLPKFADRAMVFPLIKPQSNLLSEQKIRQLAADLGFNGTATKLTTSQFRWVDGTNSRTFVADAISKNFKLETPPFRISSVISQAPSITTGDATDSVQRFLTSKLLLSNKDLENLTYNTIPSQITLGEIRQDRSVTNNAKLMKVDAVIEIPTRSSSSREATVNYKILGPNPKDSLISFSVTNSNNDIFQFPLIDFNYWEPSYQEGSQYYISPINEVWNAVQNGNGIVSYAKTDNQDYYIETESLNLQSVEIRDVSLAYYMQPEYTPYLQPIYVFEGRLTTTNNEQGDIVIYFPAVRGDFISQ